MGNAYKSERLRGHRSTPIETAQEISPVAKFARKADVETPLAEAFVRAGGNIDVDGNTIIANGKKVKALESAIGGQMHHLQQQLGVNFDALDY